MRYLTKKIYLILLFLLILFFNTKIFAKDANLKYSRENISNYFLGIVSLNENNTTSSFKYLEKVQTLKSIHSNYNANFIRTLILLEKFDQAFAFAKSLENENKLFFEANLLLGLESLMAKDYLNAEKYFKEINEFSEYNLFFEDFLCNIFRINAPQKKTILIETGLQNGTLAIVVTSLIFSEGIYLVPIATYALIMYAVILLYIIGLKIFNNN